MVIQSVIGVSWRPCRCHSHFVEHGDEDSRLVANSEFVVASGDRPVPLESLDPALDRVPSFVVLVIEAWPPATGEAGRRRWPARSAGSGNGRLDTSSARMGAVGARTVGPVGPPTIRADAGTAPPEPRNPDRRQDRPELRGVAPRAGRDEERERTLTLFPGQVNLCAQPAPGPPRRVVGRLGLRPAGRLLLQSPLSTLQECTKVIHRSVSILARLKPSTLATAALKLS